jgi:enamine deaminase RidA (YjgF/YER057c/UK114 family)
VPKARICNIGDEVQRGLAVMVWKRYFKVPRPRTTIGCTGLLVKDTLVEIDLIGARK